MCHQTFCDAEHSWPSVRSLKTISNKLSLCKFSMRQQFCPRFMPLSCWAEGAAPEPGDAGAARSGDFSVANDIVSDDLLLKDAL
jgi:hypothetical protein